MRWGTQLPERRWRFRGQAARPATFRHEKAEAAMRWFSRKPLRQDGSQNGGYRDAGPPGAGASFINAVCVTEDIQIMSEILIERGHPAARNPSGCSAESGTDATEACHLGLPLIGLFIEDERRDPLHQRTVELQRQVDRLIVERDEARGALDRLALGIVLLDKNMFVTFANASAKNILADANGAVSQRRGQFFAYYPGDQRRLKQLVKGVLQANCLPHEPRQANMTLHGVDGSLVLSACLVPILPSPADAGPPSKVALALRRLETAANLATSVRQMFDLTDTETKYAIALASGLSLREEAQAQGVRISTARTHLARIFQKTSTRQQSQLVSLLSIAAPPFRSK